MTFEFGALLFAVCGLICGSFATAASHRLPRGESIALARSSCPKCGHALGPADLLPLISWLLSLGRCRHCGDPISWRYPMIELLTVALFLLAWRQSEGQVETAAVLALGFLALLVITVADLETGLIPDAALLALAPLAVAYRWQTDGAWLDAGAGAAVTGGVAWGLRAGYKALRGRQGLGLGDVKFMGVAGVYLGLSGLAPFLIVTGLLGLLLGLGWRRMGRGAVFPLGPALCGALLVCILFPELRRLGGGY